MTNEVQATTGTAVAPAIPAFLQAHLSKNPAAPSADLASLATAQTSTPRLSLKGKVFRFMKGQDEVYKSRDPVQVFIAGVEPGPGLFTKTFYAKAYAGGDSAGEAPDCASADGVRPDPWINQPMHHECKSCPKNQWGSATSRKGKAAKACHDSKRLYILRTDAAVKDTPLTERELFLSQVPVSSLLELANYGKTIQEMGVEPWMVATELSMDEDSEFPTLGFKVAGFIGEADTESMKARVAKREWATSRNLMIQNQPARQALPPHLQATLGGGAAAAPSTTNNLVPPAAETVGTQTVLDAKPADGATVSNDDVLRKW